MTKKQKIYYSIAGLAIIIVALLIVWLLLKNTIPDSTPVDDANIVETVSSTENIVTSTTSTVKTIIKTKKNTPPLAYGEIVKQYKGYIYQFDRNCTLVNPSYLILKNGVKFVIDNRENKTHTFAFSNNKYILKAYNYVIVSATPVGTNYISCDGIHRAVVEVAP